MAGRRLGRPRIVYLSVLNFQFLNEANLMRRIMPQLDWTFEYVFR
jgi:hypothetical protein